MADREKITLTPDQLAELLAKVDAVCEQAQQLRKEIVERMKTTRQADQVDHSGQPLEHRRPQRKGP